MSNIQTLNTSNPWDQMPGETDLAYNYFVSYLKMGAAERSLEKLRKKYGRNTAYKRHLEKWSSKYDWVQRAGDYDRYLIRQALEDQEEILKRGQARLLMMMDKALDELEEVLHMGDVLIVGEGNTSVVNQRLKAVETILDRVGLVKQSEQPEINKPVSRNNYIQMIYQRIEQFKGDKTPD